MPGQTVEQILADDPELTADDIRACLASAAARQQHEVLLIGDSSVPA